MNRTLILTLALAAGLLGGLLSRYLTPTTVRAQTQSAVPKEVRAQRFTLVNEEGTVLGIFGIDSGASISGLKPKGSATIKLFDEGGHEIWSAGAPGLHPASQR